MGKIFREAASAIHSGPLRRSTPNTRAATINGWTLPTALMPTRIGAKKATRIQARSLISGHSASADAPSSTADQRTAATDSDR